MMKRRNSINGRFAARLNEMLESPAYRVLSRAAHMVLARLEIELGYHGGNDAARLPVTNSDFVEYGVHRAAIAPAIRELEALGFIRITERGRGGNAEHRSPNRFFLTYAHHRGKEPLTNDWRRIPTMEQAQQIADNARSNKNPRAVAHGKANWRRLPRKISDPGFRPVSTPDSGIERRKVPTPDSRATPPPRKRGLLSISRGGERSAPEGSAVASDPHRVAAIDLLMQSRGCSHGEAVKILESVPDAPPRSSESDDDCMSSPQPAAAGTVIDAAPRL